MSGMGAVHLSLARLLVDQDRPDAAKPHLDRALSLLPQADHHIEGLFLINMTAEWAAATGHPEVALLLRGAFVKQFTQAGFSMGASPREAERFERARLALSRDFAEELASTGGGLGYEQSMQRVRTFLAENL